MRKKFNIFFKLLIVLTVFLVSCVNDPVGEDYFNDESKVKGGTIPDTPVIWTSAVDPVYPDQCEYQVTFKFCCKTVSGACINDADSCGTDVDGDVLAYYLYVADTDPGGFEESEYYNLYYLYREVLITEDLTLTSNGTGTFYFWLTAWDGGRQSVHSNVVTVTFPSETACPQE